ncbi:MAG: DUF1240 domain-containing protein [Kluyvera sp.]
MNNKNELMIKDMTLKERVKFILTCLLAIMILTGALFFFASTSFVVIKDIFAGAETFYYDWRDVLILLFAPVMGYFDIFVFLLMLTPFTLQLARLWHKAIKAVWGYIILAFILAFPLSLYISFVPLADYHSCGQKGPFSGADYVKDPKMCEQFEYHPEKDKSDDQ